MTEAFDEDREQAQAALFEAVETQVNAAEPPEARETYDRLVGQGYSHEETMKLMACVLVEEVFGVVKNGREYDHQAYVEGLAALPKLPWEE